MKSRAVVIHEPGRASLDDVEIPLVKSEEVLIEVAYEAVCATDLEILDGELGYYKSGWAQYPITPGHEFSGRIARIGEGIDHLEVGDAVVVECIQSCGTCESCRRNNWIGCTQRKEMGVIGLNGAYAEHVIVPGCFVHKLPEGTDLKKACLCEPLAVVLKGLRRLGQAWGDEGRKRCAVVGAGPMGHFCASVLSLRGHEVTVFDRHPLRRSYFEGTGIQVAEGLEKLVAYEVLIEATGDPHALDMMLHNSGPGTVLLLLGLPYTRREFSFESVVAYDKTIVGSVGSSAKEFKKAIKILHELDLDLFLERVYPLEWFERAWQETRTKEYLKIILEMGGEAPGHRGGL